MRLFVDGQDIEYTFNTALGKVAAIAEVRVEGEYT